MSVELERALPYLKKVESGPGPVDVELAAADSPVARDLGFGVAVLYAVDAGETLRLVPHRHLAASDHDAESLHALALRNLEAFASGRIRLHSQSAIYPLILDGHFEASLILLDALWDESLAHLAPNGFVATIAARDILAFCDAASAEGPAELLAIVERLRDGDHLLTPRLIMRRGGAWHPLD